MMFRKDKKEFTKFVCILCGLVFSFAAIIPVTIYLVSKRKEGSR